MTNEQLLEEIHKSQKELICYMDQRFDRLEERMDRLEERVAKLEERMDIVEERINELEERVTVIENLLENDVLPNLRELAACYTSTYEKYVSGISRDEKFEIRFTTLCETVAEHSRRLDAAGI